MVQVLIYIVHVHPCKEVLLKHVMQHRKSVLASEYMHPGTNKTDFTHIDYCLVLWVKFSICMMTNPVFCFFGENK